jgi:hypothetical protein
MGKSTAKNEDLKIAFAGVIATFAEGCPEKSPIALVGAGMMSGILLCAADRSLMERVIEATLNASQLKANRASAESIVAMFRALEELHDKGLAGHEAGVIARQQILGTKPSN